MKRFLTVAVAMLALTGMGQVAMRKLEDLTNTNLVCVTDYGPQVVSLTQRVDATNALFSAWFSGLQSCTSYWDTAYSWGDWSVAVGANTAAIRILETNTVTRADTNGWETGSHASFLTSAPPQSVVSVNGQTGAVVVTAAQIGALTNELDLAALRTYHYGSPDIVESPAEWFVFDGAGTVTAFNWSAGRENVVIPWAIGGVPVTTIRYGALQMSGIVSVIAPQTVTAIGNGAFFYCDLLTSVSLPQATAIGDSAFEGCDSLASASLPQATAIGNSVFFYCDLLTSVSLPKAQTIGNSAFESCSSLASASLPQAQTIGRAAFNGCYSLTSVHMGRNAPAQASSVFDGITPPPTVYVTDPQATGWGAEWNGAPVVRPPLYGSNVTAQAYTLNGDTITEWPSGATNITDGVTSGTYSEATRTLDISAIMGKAITNTGIYHPVETYNVYVDPMTTTVSLVQEKTVYRVEVYTNCVIAFDVSGLNLANREAKFELQLNITETNIPAISFVGFEFNQTPEFTCTGCYKFACSTLDGITLQARQIYPTVYQWIKGTIGAGAASAQYTSLLNVGVTYPNTNWLSISIPPYYPTIARTGAYGGNEANGLFIGFASGHFYTVPNEFNILEPKMYKETASNWTLKYVYFDADNSRVVGRYLGMYQEAQSLPANVPLIEYKQANELEIKAYSQGWRP